MTPGDLGLLLQGIGAVLLALVSAVVGLRATRALSVRVEGPVRFKAVEPRRRRLP